jgi:hypothetical protein
MLTNYNNKMKEVEINVKSWNAVLKDGSELHGRECGSFIDYKKRTDIVNIFVETDNGIRFARSPSEPLPLSFDFFIHYTNYINPINKKDLAKQKFYKILLKYKDYILVRCITRDGNYHTIKESYK